MIGLTAETNKGVKVMERIEKVMTYIKINKLRKKANRPEKIRHKWNHVTGMNIALESANLAKNNAFEYAMSLLNITAKPVPHTAIHVDIKKWIFPISSCRFKNTKRETKKEPNENNRSEKLYGFIEGSEPN